MPTEPNLSPRSWQWIQRIGIALLAIGGVSRVLPLFDQGGRVFRQFPTEDGYLMLTIARNIALGNGPSIADGTILTNGTQPLATLIWAACFWLVGGDRFWGVWLVLLLEFAIACGTVVLLLHVARHALPAWPHREHTAQFAVGAWFASPLIVQNSMNALETGLYMLAVTTIAWMIVGPMSRRDDYDAAESTLRPWMVLGVALGFAFWARNDAILLCLAVGLTHLLGWLTAPGTPLVRRVVEISTSAVVVTVLALPWLAFNVIGFGHLMPISGQAESLSAEFASNLPEVPTKILEYVTLLTPLPEGIEAITAVRVGCLALLVAFVLVLAPAVVRWSFTQRALFSVGASYTLMLVLFYGLYFGAPHFMSRYLAPTATFTSLLWPLPLLYILSRFRLPDGAQLLAIGAVPVLALGLNARIYLQGAAHPHFQIVNWVERNVTSETWVGAIQTGTLGFFHDRTINLDGKVNPMALAARKTNRVLDYVADSEIAYLIDWNGIAGWSSRGALEGAFEVIVNDRQRNLAVLRRREAS